MDWFFVASFALFVLMLVGLMIFHHHKLHIVICGFVLLSVMFMVHHQGLLPWGHHFAEHHRQHLLIQLSLLLPGFALAAHYFEHSGASRAIAERLDWSGAKERMERSLGAWTGKAFGWCFTRDVVLLWIVYWLSTVLDNIAAAMIGGTILMALYGSGNIPFRMLVGIIGASNLGGAGSPVGDTTTVMMFISENPQIPVVQIMAAFVATIPAQCMLSVWAMRHDRVPASKQEAKKDHMWEQEAKRLELAAKIGEGHAEVDSEGDALALAAGAHQKQMNWRMVLPLLAVPGLIVGNVLDQPGIGLWSGLFLGMLLGWVPFNWREGVKALPNTFFLVTLVGTAEMLPFEGLVPMVMEYLRGLEAAGVSAIAIALLLVALVIIIALLSAFFDNIPLMAVCLTLMRLGLPLNVGLTAYGLGFEGSAMWFGSSAGVALGLQYPEIYDTKKWIKPYFAVTGIFLFSAAIYVAVFYGIVPLFS